MWDELKKTALLGTSKHQLPEQELAYLEKMGLDISRDPALILLDAISMWSNMKKVGLELKKWDSLLESPADATTNNPSLKLADAIAALFKYNGFEVLVPQTVGLLSEKGIAFPAELYPYLIEYFEKHPNTFNLYREQLEDRFFWLTKQNPAWTAFEEKMSIEKVEQIKPIQLKAIALQQLTIQGGQEAIGYIYNEWENYSKPLQVAFLKNCSLPASSILDSFYQKVMDEKDKDTFRFALKYFAGSKNDNYLDQIKEYVLNLVSLSRKKVKINEDAIQDLKSFILKKHLPIFTLEKGYDFEPKNLLFNFFCVVPITLLCELLECTWPDFLGGLDDADEQHDLLLLGLCYSASLHPIDQELFLQTIISGKYPILEEMDIFPVYQNMNSYQLYKLYEALLGNKFSFKDNAMETLMFHPDFKWPNELVKQIMKVLPVRLLNADDSKLDPNFIMFKNMILNCDPNMYSYINAAFQANPVYSWNSTKIIEKQLKILKMRWQILKEL